jgi:endogenous inhibitor of DNA gyrase (YacG/DUF329 family)
MKAAACPICGKRLEGESVAEWPQFPFCSRRCKTIDLGRWLGESYRVPATEPDEASAEHETDAL